MSDEISQLSKPLPDAGIQRTNGQQTKKGYDTTGYGYQWAVDRFNEVCGENWGFSWDIIDKTDGQYHSGQPYIDITVKVGIWIGSRENTREACGGHRSNTFADALKGAITNGFKKTAAFWGVGAAAYRGEIDDDNKPEPDHRDKAKGPNIIDDYLAQIKKAENPEQLEIIRNKAKADAHTKKFKNMGEMNQIAQALDSRVAELVPV